MDATNFIPQITDAFQNSRDQDIKMAAAWALATLQGDQDSVKFLVQTAQLAINGSQQSIYTSNIEALKYLGSVQSPVAKAALEMALDSQNLPVLEIAMANLVFNQNGSAKATEKIISQLNGDTPPSNQIGVTLLLNMAAKMQNDPGIAAAGERYSVGDGYDWQLYTVERKNWPIYNWMWDYTHKINK
jgi:hypothetical protein